MKVYDKTGWNLLVTARSDDTLYNSVRVEGNFCGVAFGPDSEEGIVRVDGLTLQAGRVLPIANGGAAYLLEKVNVAAGTDLTSSLINLTSVTRLQLLFAESLDELNALRQPRAIKAFTTGNINPAPSAWTRVLTVPFTGRRQALFDIQSSDGSLTQYRVFGRRFMLGKVNAPGNRVDEKLLTPATPAPAAAGAAFYIGGTDDAEDWHELALEMFPSSSANFCADVDVIGELGSP